VARNPIRFLLVLPVFFRPSGNHEKQLAVLGSSTMRSNHAVRTTAPRQFFLGILLPFPVATNAGLQLIFEPLLAGRHPVSAQFRGNTAIGFFSMKLFVPLTYRIDGGRIFVRIHVGHWHTGSDCCGERTFRECAIATVSPFVKKANSPFADAA